jgi:TonB-linked SusC/RagA family outer membrane protein
MKKSLLFPAFLSCLTLALLLCIVFDLQAQSTLTGKVTDENAAPLVGVTVMVKGTTTGTTTGPDGDFSLQVPDPNGTLVISFISYTTQEVPISNQKVINISLKPDAKALSEVVVVGYTSARKQDLTGAVAIVEMEPIKTASVSSGNPMQALQGRVPGLYIEKTGTPSGDNSRVLVRGVNTLGNTDPLYIIDGVPTKRSQVFQSLSPSTITSVQVLKDASSASIYGSRASNGVIIVTTNNGGNTDGKINVDFNTSLSAQTEKAQRYDVLNAAERGRALWQASVNDRVDPNSGYGEIYNFDWNGDYNNPVLHSVTPKPFVGGNPLVPVGDTDWQDEMYDLGWVTNNDLTLYGGTATSSLLVNLGYLHNSGMLAFTNYRRLTGRLNANTSLFDGKFKFGVNAQVASSKENLAVQDLGSEYTPATAITLVPTIPVYTSTGQYAGPLGSGYSDRNNPLHIQDINQWDDTRRSFLFGNIFAELELVDNLVLRTSVGADFSESRIKNIEQAFTEGFIARTVNSLTQSNSRISSLVWSNTARYTLTFGENNRFNLLAGMEAIRDNTEEVAAYRENFAVQSEDYFVLNAASGNTSAIGSSTGSRLLSQFGRIDYAFGERYLAALTLRRDGSSRFGEDNRYGIFPAASIGWRIDQEPFMQGMRLFSGLKLRAGVGRIGNQDIGDLARFGLFEPRYGTRASQLSPVFHNNFFDQYYNIGTAYDLNGTNSGALPSGFVSTQAGNPNLKWEETDELNLGLDFSFLEGSLTGSFDYFDRETSDILIRPPVASAVGEGQLRYVNGAVKTNKGWEISLAYTGKSGGPFTYSVSTNVFRFKDKITVLPEEVRSAYPGNAVTSVLGHSQLDLFGYRTDGIFQNQQEVDAHASQVGKAPGRIRYRDLNGDGRVNDLDQEFFGTQLPAFSYGARIDLGFQNFDLSLFGAGVAGRTGPDRYIFFNDFIRGRENVGPGVFRAWTPQNTGSSVPSLTLADANSETRISDYLSVSTSYFKLRNAQLGYSLPVDAINKIAGMQKLRLYFMVDNVFWFKSADFKGPDPERVNLQDIPVPRSFTFGVNVSL